MFLSPRFGAEFFVTFWLVLSRYGSAARAAFPRKELMMQTHAKTVFLGILSLAGLLALPPLATARGNHWGQHEGREHRSEAELSARDRRSFEAYLDAHWETAQLLYRQPELINDRHFLRDHRALRDWLADHTKAARVIQANPRQVLWEQRTAHPRTADTVSPEDVRSLDHYLDTHWEAADALYRDPELINDTRFVHAHPSLDNWLQERPDAAQAISERPRDFFWRQRTLAPQDFLRQLFNQ
ncbi:MAG TPA: hypothetical protein VGX03_11500 [Candidatus Binatia bacterium]|jgi:hypothetical protein|nr:hypothetical protein [Candidatus Binatia bacterium]